MTFVRLLATACSLLSLIACSMDISVEDLNGPDFLNSRIISTTEGIADNATDLIITIELKNSDESLVIGHIPDMSLVAGITVSIVECSASNELGIAICRVRSAFPGTATVAIGNIKIDLQTDVEFSVPVQSGSFIQILSGAQNNIETVDGYRITTQIGAPFAGLYQEVDGYKIYTNTTSTITPTDDRVLASD